MGSDGHAWPPAERHGQWMGCFSGGQFWPLDPRVEDVRIEDIAHHLAMRCRYGGACRFFYSVAEHSVIVSRYVPKEFALEGLLHDAAEAYIGDMVRPLKYQPEMVEFRRAEARIEPVIMRSFGIETTPASRAAVKAIDDRICVDEIQALMSRPEKYLDRRKEEELGCIVAGLDWRQAEDEFLCRFDELRR